jgi:hypothetical protein
MKRQETEIRDQGSEQMEKLLRQTLPPIGDASGPDHDLWPAMLRKLDERPAAVPWFDWALMGALAAMIAVFPAAIPVLLYYL